MRRVSTAASLYRAAMAGLREAAREVRESGSFGYLVGSERRRADYSRPTQPGAPQRQRSLPSWCVSP